MNVGTMESPRRTRLAVGLVLLVLASGAGGMLVAAYVHGGAWTAESAVRAASATPARLAAPRASAPGRMVVPSSPEQDDVAENGSAAGSKAAAEGATRPGVVRVPPAETSATAAPEVIVPAGHSPGYVAEDEEIGLVLRRWQEAQLSNDAGQVALSYAPMVDRYFLRSHVNREFVRANLLVQQARGISLRSYTLRHIEIGQVSGEDVEVHFLASFTVDSPEGERTGDARTELKLHREEGDWKIVYERDYRG